MSSEPSNSVGRVLGRYQLLSSIARGGMGQVWLGRLHGARGFHKLVAIKTLLPASDEAGRMENMLLEEARIAALIHHPNVVQTIELGEDDGTLYMVMEWVDGEPLSTVLTDARDRGGFPLAVAASLVGQTLRGLHAAHELCDDSGASLGVVHRDVSPHNVLVTYAGAAKLLDFGIAKATKGTSGHTTTGEIKGKFAYMAPEQVLGTAIDRRTDLFAAGIMLYTMTAGRHPFKHHNDAGVLHGITSEQPAPPPSRFVPDYPAALEAVVMKAIEKDATRRFATAEEMRLALERALPAAFGTGEAEVRNFIGNLLAERARARREAVRRILLRADAQTPAAGVAGLAHASQSGGSLRGFSVDRQTTGSGKAQTTGSGKAQTTGSRKAGMPEPEPAVARADSKAPLARSRKRYQLAMVAAVAVAAGALLFAAKSVTWRGATAGPGVAAAPVVVKQVVEPPATPSPKGIEEPTADAPSPPVEVAAPPVSPTSSAKQPVPSSGPAAERPTSKAKRGAKSAPSDDLIAPDYAR